jgi:hypothetical protein
LPSLGQPFFGPHPTFWVRRRIFEFYASAFRYIIARPEHSGNWQFSITSLTGTPPAAIAGSIARSGSSVSGAVHVDGSNCFDHLITISLTGTLTGSNISLASTSVDGQVVTFTGSISDNAFTGTYTIDGGDCADGDHGNVTGIRTFSISGYLPGIFTTSGGATFDVVADNVAQSSPSSEG